MVDRFLPVSNFVAEHLVKYGIPRARIVVRPNFAQPRGPVQPLGSGFLFVGRLTPEKGASLLVSAWTQSRLWRQHRLVIAGDGPERDLVLSARQHNVDYVGIVDSSRVSMLLDDAAVVVIPSLCYEGFPRLVAEAFERGRPVAATPLGALGDLITPEVGWTAPPEADAFAKMLSLAISDPNIQERATTARAVFERDFHPLVTTASLVALYEDLKASSRNG